MILKISKGQEAVWEGLYFVASKATTILQLFLPKELSSAIKYLRSNSTIAPTSDTTTSNNTTTSNTISNTTTSTNTTSSTTSNEINLNEMKMETQTDHTHPKPTTISTTTTIADDVNTKQ